MRDVYQKKPAGLTNQMLFPHILFETVNSVHEKQKAAVSALLMGEQRSGKSYLATMAVRPQTWERHVSTTNERLDSFNYVYTTPVEGERPWEPFAERTVAVSVDRIPDGKLLIPATTQRLHHNISAVFIGTSKSTSAARSAQTPSKLGGLFNTAIDYFSRGSGRATRQRSVVRLDDGTFHRAVVFHDIKGEQARPEYDDQVARLIDRCDKVVIVVPATDLGCFRPTILADADLSAKAGIDPEYDAIRTVRRSIQAARPVAKKVVIAVTKIDAIRGLTLDPGQYPKWHELQARQALNDPNTYAPDSRDAEAQLLLELLGSNDGETALKSLITQDRVPVFFTWSETIGEEPRAGGIARFVLQGCLQIAT